MQIGIPNHASPKWVANLNMLSKMGLWIWLMLRVTVSLFDNNKNNEAMVRTTK
jgi:hypothetical protein